jgi:hypothetical protein
MLLTSPFPTSAVLARLGLRQLWLAQTLGQAKGLGSGLAWPRPWLLYVKIFDCENENENVSKTMNKNMDENRNENMVM